MGGGRCMEYLLEGMEISPMPTWCPCNDNMNLWPVCPPAGGGGGCDVFICDWLNDCIFR